VSDREPLNIQLTQINAATPKEVKEIPDGTINPVVKVITTKQKMQEKVMADCEEIADVETDPESLFNSDKLDEIIGEK
jgi:hypothetical protein